MAKISYISNVTIEKKPTVIFMNFMITETDESSKAVVKKINKKRIDLKKFVQNRSSYREDSYKQTTIHIRRLENKVYYYENDNGDIISYEEYNNLPGSERMSYSKKFRTDFMGYQASLNISIILNNSETVVKDFSAITSMSVKKDINCDFDCGILPEEQDNINKQLYIECSTKGIKAIHEIAKGIGGQYYTDKTTIISIMDPAVTSPYNADIQYERAMKTASIPEEPIITPEIIEDIFNNNVTFTKKLEIIAEIENI